DVAPCRRVKKLRISQFLQAGIDESYPEKEAHWQEHPFRHVHGLWLFGLVDLAGLIRWTWLMCLHSSGAIFRITSALASIALRSKSMGSSLTLPPGLIKSA